MIHAVQNLLTKILTDHPPRSLLCVGRGTAAVFKEYLSHHPDCQMVQMEFHDADTLDIAMRQLHIQGLFDFAIVANAIEHVTKTAGMHLLARLRDVHSRKMIVVVPIDEQGSAYLSHWQEADFIALGFILKAKIKLDAQPLHVYAFDIETYKTTPDWLNNQYWANPHLWNKYWW